MDPDTWSAAQERDGLEFLWRSHGPLAADDFTSSFLGDADWHNFILVFIDSIENGRSRKQGDFMLSAAPTEKDSYSKFLHFPHSAS